MDLALNNLQKPTNQPTIYLCQSFQILLSLYIYIYIYIYIVEVYGFYFYTWGVNGGPNRTVLSNSAQD